MPVSRLDPGASSAWPVLFVLGALPPSTPLDQPPGHLRLPATLMLQEAYPASFYLFFVFLPLLNLPRPPAVGSVDLRGVPTTHISISRQH